MGLIDDAIARDNARPVKVIDYPRMKKELPKQKAALTRAVKTGDPEKVAQACKDAIEVWNEIGAWPDDWGHWQRALDDMLPYTRQVNIQDL